MDGNRKHLRDGALLPEAVGQTSRPEPGSIRDAFMDKPRNRQSRGPYRDRIPDAIKVCRTAIASGNKILIFGNGGSASQADHFAAELVGSGMRCIALTNPAIITAIVNDHAPVEMFRRQVQVYGDPGDVAIGLTTSGSQNVLMALQKAHKKGMTTILMSGSFYWWYYVDIHCYYGGNTQEVQEQHLASLHRLWKGIM